MSQVQTAADLSPASSWRLFLFPVCSFLFTFIYWLILSFLPIYLKGKGFPDPLIGTIFGTFSISTLFLMVPLGILSDRVSPKKVLFAGALMTLVHVLGMKSAQQVYAFLLLAVCGGMGWATYQIVLLSLYLKLIGEERRGTRIAFYTAGQFLGFGVGPLVAGMLWGRIDYSRILDFAVIASVLLMAATVALHDSPPIPFRLGEYRSDLAKPHILLFLLVYFVYATHLGTEHTAFTLLMEKDLGFSTADIGLTFFAIGVWMCVWSPLAGRRFDLRHKLVSFLMFGLVVSALFQIATAYAADLPWMILVRVAHTLGDVPVFLAMGILTATFFSQGRLGGNSAVVYMVRTLGVFVGNVGAGLLAASVGYGGTFVVNGLLVLAAVILLYPRIRRHLDVVDGGR